MFATRYFPGLPAPASAQSRLRPLLRVAVHGAAIAWRVLSTRRELVNMDERMLADIGITRHQAHREATRWFWRA